MSIVSWYKRLSSRKKGRIESAFQTGLVVVVAYLSPYIASQSGVPFDRLFFGIAVGLIVVLNVISHYPPVRGSRNRWVVFTNHSIGWSFGVFIGALSAAVPILVGLIPQFPYAIVVIVGTFLFFVFETIDLGKYTDELVKPEPVTEASASRQTKRLTLWRWILNAEKRVMEFGEKHPRSSVSAIAIFAALVVIYFAGGDDRVTLTAAAQSMIELVAFLAAASGALTAIYLGQILKGIPENVAKTVPPYQTIVNRAIAEAASRATDQESQNRLIQEAMTNAYTNWFDSLDDSMSGAKRIRSGGRYPLYFLVASAFVSVSSILSGSSVLLGVSIGLVVLATWAIFRSWRIAEGSMKGAMWISKFFEGVRPQERTTEQAALLKTHQPGLRVEPLYRDKRT